MYRSIRVYIAGAYSADNVIDLARNISIGSQTANMAEEAGFAVYSPWDDFQRFVLAGSHRTTVEDKYRCSMAWLEVSDALLVAENPYNSKSKGLEAELIRARHLGIPIFHDLDALCAWGKEKVGGVA